MEMKQCKYGKFPRWTLEELLGDPLPEIDQAYFDAIPEFFLPSANYDYVPYFLWKIFTPDELAMARALPGTPAEVAEKTGFDGACVAETLERLVSEGKITVAGPTYVRLTPMPPIYIDYIYFSLDNRGVEIDEDVDVLMKLCRMLSREVDSFPSDQPRAKGPMRCIPKEKSIKGIPGAMDCESLEWLVRDAFSRGEFGVERCFCRVGMGLWTQGEYNEEVAKKTTPSGFYEGQGPLDGHCLVLGKTAKHWRATISQPEPTEADVERILSEIEDHNVVLIGSRTRAGGNICTCDYATCHPNGRYEAWDVRPSRFRPVTDADECVSCGACAKTCQLGAISLDGAGLPVVDEELCLGCGNCVVFCPRDAKEMELFRPVEWIPDGDMHMFTPMPLEQ